MGKFAFPDGLSCLFYLHDLHDLYVLLDLYVPSSSHVMNSIVHPILVSLVITYMSRPITS